MIEIFAIAFLIYSGIGLVLFAWIYWQDTRGFWSVFRGEHPAFIAFCVMFVVVAWPFVAPGLIQDLRKK